MVRKLHQKSNVFNVPNFCSFTKQGHRHPMKPHRLTLTNSLVMNYDLHKRMKVNSNQNKNKTV